MQSIFFIKHFEYVTKKEYGPVKEELISLIRMVQEDVKEDIVTQKLLTTDGKEKLARYERLLKGGVISEEEYEQKVEEIMK